MVLHILSSPWQGFAKDEGIVQGIWVNPAVPGPIYAGTKGERSREIVGNS